MLLQGNSFKQRQTFRSTRGAPLSVLAQPLGGAGGPNAFVGRLPTTCVCAWAPMRPGNALGGCSPRWCIVARLCLVRGMVSIVGSASTLSIGLCFSRGLCSPVAMGTSARSRFSHRFRRRVALDISCSQRVLRGAVFFDIHWRPIAAPMVLRDVPVTGRSVGLTVWRSFRPHSTNVRLGTASYPFATTPIGVHGHCRCALQVRPFFVRHLSPPNVGG